MECTTHVYEVRPRVYKRGVDLISGVLPFGRLWYDTPDNAIGYAMCAANKIHNAIAGWMLIANARHAQPLLDQTDREREYRRLQLQKRSQHFIGVHNETPSVAAMRVCNPDRSASLAYTDRA